MKNITLLTVFLLFAINSFAQEITRGPDIGDIYFLGPTHTGTGLYYSTNFGETAVCVDSTLNAISITADKTQGGIYCQKMPVNLYYSQNFGYQNTWVLKQGDISDDINSGVTEGFIFNHIASHSENYGSNFINHAANGFFGSLKASEIDNQIGTGYAVVKSSSIPDSVFLLISYDNFENLYIINAIHEDTNIFRYLTRGNNEGELFTVRYRTFTFNPYEIYHCDDFGNEFTKMNEINIYNYYSYGVEGGRQNGELYMLYTFVNLMWQNAHIYIYYSIDYGQTFDVYHPFGKGNEPVLSNFSTLTKEVSLMDEIEFDNYSIGDIIEYQWDFDNDGTIDSFDEFPVFTYQDTGYYSVKLSVVGQDSLNIFVRENYIHVIDTSTNVIENNKELHEVILYPNPFSDNIIIKNNGYKHVEIYNNIGEQIKKISSGNNTITWDGNNTNGRKCSPGIYYLKINNSVHKVILTK